jgi:DAK2 domain fusion protein YloV
VHVLESLDADANRGWSVAAVHTLDAHRAEIDDLKVFPVPDGDTGTNLAVTLRAGADALAAARAVTVGDALAALARGAIIEARGNSGVIVAQLLHGMATAATGVDRYCTAELRRGLAEGVAQAYRAVAEPVEGTILTVARAASEHLPAGDVPLEHAITAAVAAADSALVHTRDQLSALTRAGVVDAGGRGLVLLLAALATVVTGRTPALTNVAAPAGRSRVPRESGSATFEYEVQYLLQAGADATATLRERLSGLGDSVVVAGTGDGTWNVHAHVNDVGAAIEAGLAAGPTRRISVVRFADSADSADSAGGVGEAATGTGERAPGQAGDARTRTGSAVVTVAPGAGVGHLFAGEGVVVLEPDAGANLQPHDVAAAVRGTGAAEVVLLPNAERMTQVAHAAADQVRADGVRVAVVPTRSPVQGLAAIAVHDPARRFDDDVVAMAEAAAATRFAEITVATERSLTSVGICQQGDLLGLIDGEVVEIGHGLVAVAFALVSRLLGVGVELMTVLVGADAPAGLGELIAGHVRERAPLTDVSVYVGGQPRYPLIIGVE